MANTLNCADVPVDEAYAYALAQCEAENKELSNYFSAFKSNYQMLQDKCDLALDLPRIEMPVIEPEHMDDFQESIESGEIDVAEPLSNIDSKYPTDLKFDVRGRSWLVKGLRDGSDTDDILDVEKTEIAVRDLKPSQSQIWLEKVVGMSLYFGPLTQSSDFLHEAPIIVSRDGYILDGHHRFGAAMVSNPSLRLLALKVDMPIRELVKMARSYGNAIGNEQKAAETFESDGGIQVAKGYDKWWDELDAIRNEYPPDKFYNRRLGNPKWEDAILEQLFKDGWTPKEALFSWKYYYGSPHHFSFRPQDHEMRRYEKNLNQATTKKCKNCGETGHTARSCKNERVRETRYTNDKATRLKLSRKLTAISKTGQSHKYTIDDMNYALGALVSGREWNQDSQNIGVTIALSEHPSARLVEKNWNDIQDMRDDLGVDDFKKMVDATKWGVGAEKWSTYMAENEQKAAETNPSSPVGIFLLSFITGIILGVNRTRDV